MEYICFTAYQFSPALILFHVAICFLISETGQRPQYLLKGGIPAIISKDRWLAVQKLLKERRFSKKLTEKPDIGVFVRRVKTGALQGFVYINPSWGKKEIAQVLEKLSQERN